MKRLSLLLLLAVSLLSLGNVAHACGTHPDVEVFILSDTNQDQKVTRQEVAVGLSKRRGCWPAISDEKERQKAVDRWFSQHDRNKDGTVTRAEFDATHGKWLLDMELGIAAKK